ncbi:MAG: hypothetical protein J5601_05855 [Elusimicrobiaceae bacterium]|nr:hypothetical protein [Elusimicrobiaceae bacterium]
MKQVAVLLVAVVFASVAPVFAQSTSHANGTNPSVAATQDAKSATSSADAKQTAASTKEVKKADVKDVKASSKNAQKTASQKGSTVEVSQLSRQIKRTCLRTYTSAQLASNGRLGNPSTGMQTR